MSVPSPGEYVLYVRRYAPFNSFGGGFEGDARSFSTSLKVTSRTVGEVTFGPQLKKTTQAKGFSDGSAYVGPFEVRKKVPLGKINTSVGQVNIEISHETSSPGRISFTLYTEGNLPLKDIALPGKLARAINWVNNKLRPNSRNPQGTPDIDTFVDFVATFTKSHAVFEGVVRGDGFPNAEVFVIDSNERAVPLLDYRTRSGVMGPTYRLFGTHAKNQLAAFKQVVTLSPNGNFANVALSPKLVHEK
jgi:hypothetical protein